MTSREMWVQIQGYEGRYEVSNHGRVRSVDRISTSRPGVAMRLKGRLLNPSPGRYLRVDLYKGGVSKHHTIHRLVATAFSPGWAPGLIVLHGDGDNHNNHASNLRWGTPAENTADILRHGRNYHANRKACANGHPFEGDNFRIDSKGARECRTCRRDSGKRRRERDRARRHAEAMGLT